MNIEIFGHTIIDTRERDEFGRLYSQPLTEKEIRASDHILRRANQDYVPRLKDLTLRDRIQEIREEIGRLIKR
jgi:hypothetical protein